MTKRNNSSIEERLLQENEELRAKLAESEETLRAIQSGEVDAIVVSTDKGEQIYTLMGADEPYRILFEQMGEGAVTMAEDGSILYCNRSFAKIMRTTLDKIIGVKFERFLHLSDVPSFRESLKRCADGPIRKELTFETCESTLVPMQLSMSLLSTARVPTYCIVVGDLTERVQAEERLREANETLEQRVEDRTMKLAASEVKYSNLFSIMGEGLQLTELLFDEHGRPNDFIIHEVNHAYERQTGIPNEEALGRRLSDGLGFIEPVWLERYGTVVKEGRSVTFEEYNQALDKWFEVHAYPMLEMNYFAALFNDITKRKKAEEALRESETKYRGLFNSMAEYLQLLDLIYDDGGRPIDYILLDVNPTWERLTGLKKEKVVGHRGKELFGVVEDSRLEAFDKVIKTGEPTRFDNYDAAIDKYYTINAWKAGENQCAFTAFDITDVKRAQQRVEKSETRLKLIMDNIPVAVGITDDRGGNEVDNGILDSIWRCVPETRYTEDYHLFMAWWPDTGERLKPEDWPIFIALKGEVVTDTLNIERFDGSRGTIIASAKPVFDSKGKVSGAVWSVQDITDLKEKEEALRRSNAELQQFAYISSHDIQEPLRMVVSYLTLLDKKYKDQLDPKAQDYVQYAVKGGIRMRELIDDLLLYSRLDTNAKEFAPVAMSEVVENTITILKLPIEESRANIVVGPLPTINADESQMTQVMQNLISNAIKFRGSERPIVQVSALQGSVEWTFAVKDNGIGLNMEHTTMLFHMFQRLQTRDIYPGTGIGLAIAKKIVESHGGRIWVESEEGKGATFYFTIPKRGGGRNE